MRWKRGYVSEDAQNASGVRRGTGTQITVAGIGAFLYTIFQFTWPKPPQASVLYTWPGDGPIWVTRVIHLYGNYYFELAAFVYFIFLAVYNRKHRRGWIYALLSGWCLPEIALFHWLR